MQLFDEKRAAYSEILQLAVEYRSANRKLLLGPVDPEYDENNDDYTEHWLPFTEDELAAYRLHGPEVAVKGLARKIDRILTEIELLAPDFVYDAAIDMCLAGLPESLGLSSARANFLTNIREDLGTSVTLKAFERDIGQAASQTGIAQFPSR